MFYTNTGLKSTTKWGNLRQYFLKMTIQEIRFIGQRLLPGISQQYVCVCVIFNQDNSAYYFSYKKKIKSTIYKELNILFVLPLKSHTQILCSSRPNNAIIVNTSHYQTRQHLFGIIYAVLDLPLICSHLRTKAALPLRIWMT